MSDPHRDPKQRDRQIAHNESVRQATSAIRISVWAIAVAAMLAVVAFGWVAFVR